MEHQFDPRKWPQQLMNNAMYSQSYSAYNYPTSPSPSPSPHNTTVDSSLSDRWYYPTTPGNSSTVLTNPYLMSTPKEDAMFPPALDIHPVSRLQIVPCIPCLHEACACNKGERSKFRTSKNQREHHKKGWLHNDCSESCKVCRELIAEGNLWKSIQDRKNRSDKTKLRREITKKKRMEYQQIPYSGLPMKRSISDLGVVSQHTHHPLQVIPPTTQYLPISETAPAPALAPAPAPAPTSVTQIESAPSEVHDMFAFTTPVFDHGAAPLQFPEDAILQTSQSSSSSSSSPSTTSSSVTHSPEEFVVHSFDHQYNGIFLQPFTPDSYVTSNTSSCSQDSNLEYHDILQWWDVSQESTSL